MTAAFIAEFESAEALQAAAATMRHNGYRLIDAFSPFPMPELEDVLDLQPTRIRSMMLVAGLTIAGLAFGLQWYSAVIDYPINSGGRPLNSWPVFLLFPFEVGIFAAALAGALTMLWECGLPRLHHAVFDIAAFDRAMQDRFFLMASDPRRDDPSRLRHSFYASGAVEVAELRT